MKKILALGLGIVLVAAACNNTPTPVSTSNTDDTNTQIQTGTVEIDMTSAGFSPSNVTVKAGTVVVFKNMDSKARWPASDPHPTHTDLPGFDALQGVAAGKTYSFTFTQVGTWGFHDHLFSNLRGSVTVTE